MASTAPPPLPGDRLLAEVSRTGARDQAARCGHGRRPPRGGRRVDVERTRRCRRSERNDSLSRQKRKPSAGLEPEAPLTIPRQLVATDGNGFRLFPPFSGVGDLPPVATPGLHNGSIRERQAQNGKAGRRLSASGRTRSFYT